MRDASVDLLQPFVLGCDTKQVKIVQLCLTSIQKLLQHHIVNQVVHKHDDKDFVSLSSFVFFRHQQQLL